MSGSYEGLNLPQLLDLLHPPVMPEPVPWLPQTVGWRVVGAWALFAAVALGVHAYRKWKRNRYRREALKELEDIARHRDEARAPGEIALLLKRTALVVYPRERVASLYGSDWAAFLVQSSKHDSRVEKAAPDLAVAAYRDDSSAKTLIKPARRWIRVHRA